MATSDVSNNIRLEFIGNPVESPKEVDTTVVPLVKSLAAIPFCPRAKKIVLAVAAGSILARRVSGKDEPVSTEIGVEKVAVVEIEFAVFKVTG